MTDRWTEVEPVVQLTLADVIRADLREFVIAAGTAAIGVALEHERAQLVGPRYVHLPGRETHRAGFAPGELVLGGRRVQVRRPRGRTIDGDGGAGSQSSGKAQAWRYVPESFVLPAASEVLSIPLAPQRSRIVRARLAQSPSSQ